VGGNSHHGQLDRVRQHGLVRFIGEPADLDDPDSGQSEPDGCDGDQYGADKRLSVEHDGGEWPNSLADIHADRNQSDNECPAEYRHSAGFWYRAADAEWIDEYRAECCATDRRGRPAARNVGHEDADE
jgi:hypothetical protein